MARVLTHSLPSNTLESAIRFHFGLTQAELGRYLGVSGGFVAHLEAGRRQPAPLVNRRLTRLAQLLPPPEGTGPVAPAFAGPGVPPVPNVETLLATLPALGVLPPAALRKRQRAVAAQAAGLRWALHRASQGAALHARRQWELARLQAARPDWVADAAEQAHLDRWLGVLAADVAAATPSPAALAEQALLRVRLLALDVEVAALAQLLGAEPGNGE